ncbi:MAG TPA: DMT family transporter [Pseudonocardia sp.]|nr:DMT family transporter [Pseudonocardia sp.]
MTATGDRTWLVALAAALWGTDALLRQPLAGALPATTVVFWEHLIIVLTLVPWLPSAVRAWRAARWRDRLALVLIGAGASAVATVLFTEALRLGDPITPLVLQKLQPLIAIGAAGILLGERPRPQFVGYALPALAGAWLMTFPDPLRVQAHAVSSALLAIGAAVLWALGTVCGRLVSSGETKISSADLTALRFVIGLPAAALVLVALGDPVAVGGAQLGVLVVLAWVPGLLGLALYYLGLRGSAASRASLAELTFPVTATIIGVTALGARLTVTQWLGMVLVVAAVTALGLRERSSRPLIRVPTSAQSGTDQA